MDESRSEAEARIDSVLEPAQEIERPAKLTFARWLSHFSLRRRGCRSLMSVIPTESALRSF